MNHAPDLFQSKKRIHAGVPGSPLLVGLWVFSLILAVALAYFVCQSGDAVIPWLLGLLVVGYFLILPQVSTGTEVTIDSDNSVQISLWRGRGNINLKFARDEIVRLVSESSEDGDGGLIFSAFLEVRGVGVILLPYWTRELAFTLGDSLGIASQDVTSTGKTYGLSGHELARISRVQNSESAPEKFFTHF
jgi:hypothetical protein